MIPGLGPGGRGVTDDEPMDLSDDAVSIKANIEDLSARLERIKLGRKRSEVGETAFDLVQAARSMLLGAAYLVGEAGISIDKFVELRRACRFCGQSEGNHPWRITNTTTCEVWR